MVAHRAALRFRAEHQGIALPLGERFHASRTEGWTRDPVPALADGLTSATHRHRKQALAGDTPYALHALVSLGCKRPPLRSGAATDGLASTSHSCSASEPV